MSYLDDDGYLCFDETYEGVDGDYWKDKAYVNDWLGVAAKYGKVELVKALVNYHDADSNAIVDGKPVWTLAATPEIRDFLLTTTVWKYVQENDVYGLKNILPIVDVNIARKNGDTLLHHAENVEIVDMLIKASVNVNAVNGLGQTPMFKASPEKAARLHKKGAKIHVIDKDGNTPLHKAKTADESEYFLLHGGQVNCANKDGLTPIYTGGQSPERMTVLFKYGATVEAPFMQNAKKRALYCKRIERVKRIAEQLFQPQKIGENNALQKVLETRTNEPKTMA